MVCERKLVPNVTNLILMTYIAITGFMSGLIWKHKINKYQFHTKKILRIQYLDLNE